jgi:1-acyl-sn-glycerol-3-phosphate acyltransferase
MGRYRAAPRKPGPVWQFNRLVIKPFMLIATRRDLRHADRIPANGGAILAVNHVSQIDPLLIGWLAWEYGRVTSFLAKHTLFGKSRALDWWLERGGHLPVNRSAGAAGLKAAVDAINDGALVVVYVEGSITKDPAGWPMRPKTGAARIALATGAPVIPIGQWGAQDLLPAYSNRLSLRRPTIGFNVGEPVRLDDLADRDDSAAIHAATDLIMAAIVGLVEELREAPAPAKRYDPTAHGIADTGNPAGNPTPERP